VVLETSRARRLHSKRRRWLQERAGYVANDGALESQCKRRADALDAFTAPSVRGERLHCVVSVAAVGGGACAAFFAASCWAFLTYE
jgi:hypothetical protein